jgi:predicted DNA binding CopG/RHH family protein
MKKNYNLKSLKKKPGKVKVDPEATRVMISLKVDAHDLVDLKNEAERMGMPYQTFINSVLHRFISGELIDKRELGLIKFG